MKPLLLFLLLPLLFFSCSDKQKQRRELYQKWLLNNGKIKVLSTTAMIDDLVRGVGKEHVDSWTLIQGDLDPHSYQLVKGDDEKLSFAQVIFYNGLGLEHGPSLFHYLQENKNATGLGDLVYRDHQEEVILVQNQKDPHIWMDISIWKQTIPYIVEVLAAKDPSHKEEFEKNAEALTKELEKAHEEVKAEMHQVDPSKRYLVTSHDAFNYFARAYLSEEEERKQGTWTARFAAPEGLAPESQLSVSDIRSIINYLKKFNIEVIFPESNVSRHSINKIIQAATEEGIRVKIACCPLYGDAMGPPGSNGDSYLKMILYNGKEIAKYLRGEGE